MNKGQQVMVRSTFNQPIVRSFLSESNGVVEICRDEAFKKWQSAGEIPNSVTVSKRDIFVYDAKLFDQMKKYDELVDSFPEELRRLWSKAIPLYPA